MCEIKYQQKYFDISIVDICPIKIQNGNGFDEWNKVYKGQKRSEINTAQYYYVIAMHVMSNMCDTNFGQYVLTDIHVEKKIFLFFYYFSQFILSY